MLTVVTPQSSTWDLSEVEGEPLTYWKQILPEGSIRYGDRTLTFDADYHRECIKSFRDGVVQQTAFQLANPLNGHGRDMDPERQRALVEDMRLAEPDEQPGLYAKLRFFDAKAARSVRDNPGLGVSARIRENMIDKAGRRVKAAVVHVLGTLDPVVTGMSPWRAVDLSSETEGDMLDLSNSEYEGVGMAKGKSGTAVLDDEPLTVEQIREMSDADLEALLDSIPSGELDDELDDELEDDTDEDTDENADDDADTDADVDDETDEDDSDDEPDDDTQEASLSTSQRRALDLSNAAVREADRKATDALRRAAAAEWKAERAQYADAGVPPADLDLAAPILSRPEEFVVDLSNEDGAGAELNVAQIVRALLESREGTIDMSRELGHGANGDDEDEDAALLAAWDAESPLSNR